MVGGRQQKIASAQPEMTGDPRRGGRHVMLGPKASGKGSEPPAPWPATPGQGRASTGQGQLANAQQAARQRWRKKRSKKILRQGRIRQQRPESVQRMASAQSSHALHLPLVSICTNSAPRCVPAGYSAAKETLGIGTNDVLHHLALFCLTQAIVLSSLNGSHLINRPLEIIQAMNVAHFGTLVVRFSLILRTANYHWHIAAPDELVAKRMFVSVVFVKVLG
jgi:hypothetical protein